MTVLTLSDGDLKIRVAAKGGALVDGYYKDEPIFRPYAGAVSASINPLKCASFPFVPFGNRVEENTFDFGGNRYNLSANTGWDRHYLHGDGWLSDWTVTARDGKSAILTFRHSDGNYSYAAEQKFMLEGGRLTLSLSVKNTGSIPMPFGIGHHLFFPLTPQTKLEAPAQSYWSEKHDFLPDECLDIPQAFDFSSPALLPRQWINNGFDGWNSRAAITWPENGLKLNIACDPVFDRYFLFHSDKTFEPDFKGDYFCLEPMSHSANGHNLPDGGGLVKLANRETLTGTCVFEPDLL